MREVLLHLNQLLDQSPAGSVVKLEESGFRAGLDQTGSESESGNRK